MGWVGMRGGVTGQSDETLFRRVSLSSGEREHSLGLLGRGGRSVNQGLTSGTYMFDTGSPVLESEAWRQMFLKNVIF